MIVSISSDAEADLAEGYRFYERQSPELVVIAVIDARRDPLWIRRRLG